MVATEKTAWRPKLSSNKSQPDPYAFSGGRDGALNYIATIFPYLRGRKQVLDLGCGQGFLLKELQAANITAIGIDTNAKTVRQLQEEGLTVHAWEVFDFLDMSIEANFPEYDTVVASHLIEHFDADQQIRLLKLTYDLLPTGGRLIIITPNLRNPIVAAENFWLDTDHKRPMPLPLLYQLTRDIGFTTLAAGSHWPWQRNHSRSEMRQAGHDVPLRSLRRNLQIIIYYLRMMALYGPQLNLLRGDSWFIADK